VDAPLPADTINLARGRVHHAIVCMYSTIGLSYVGLFYWFKMPGLALLLLVISLNTVVVLFRFTRRGQIELGGKFLSWLFFFNITVALVARGGMHSNSAVWLLLAPILATFTVGPRHGVVISGATVLVYIGLWTAESLGLPLPPGLPAEYLAWMPVFDYPSATVATGAMLWSQAGLWEMTLKELSSTNTALRDEVQTRQIAEQKAQAAAEAKGIFLATVSHEVRTPLNGILGIAQLLEGADLSEEHTNLVRTLRRSGHMLNSILSDILDYSKIEKEHIVLESLPVSLAELSRDLYQLWHAHAADQGLELALVLDPALPAWLLCDPTRLKQILNNLISNALKFTEDGSVTVCFEARGEGLSVSVTDTGIGIPREAVDKIFTMFEQADGSTTRQYGGTGLGLAISRRLARLMGGDLSVASSPGRGSCFSLTLPLRESAAPRARASVARADIAGLRVLVAEDNAINQLVVRRLLEQQGAEVEVVSNGLEAVQSWKRAPPDVILMDCQMPVCDGYTATRLLRQAGAHLPILALTANTLEGDRQRCLEAGMDAHISKPVDLNQLLVVLARADRRTG